MPRTDPLIEARVFEPETFSAATNAFDESWASIRYMFAGQPQSIIEDARSVLANAILNAAAAGHTTADVLKQEGIRAVKSAYPHISL
ncbi:MAG: hypothetical protein ACKVP3_04600 [Hyphomicrobiaceae bacterium]